MTGGMSWESPPPTGHGYDWAVIARQLQSRPNEWLKVFDDGPLSIVNAIRQAQIAALRPAFRPGEQDGVQVRTRNNKPGPPRTATMYLRWATNQEGT